MHFTTLMLSGLGLAASASAAQIFVDNKCNFPLYLQSKQGDAAGSVITLPANKNTAFAATIPGANVKQSSLTVSRQPDLSSPLQAVYNVGTNPDRTYYDLSSVSCPPRTTGDCPNTYSPGNPGGKNAVFNQGTNANLILQLCSSNGNSS
jgi:hypothetical protein